MPNPATRLRTLWICGVVLLSILVFGTAGSILLPQGSGAQTTAIAWADDNPAGTGHADDAHSGGHGSGDHGDSNLAEKLPWFSVLPFVLLLVAIAVLPLAAHHWWERLRNRALVSFGLSLPIAIYLGIHGTADLLHSMQEYVGFIALLGSLYVISGGIVLRGDIQATPRVNTTFLLAGAILANIVGTTGASMLLIRPFLRTNSQRSRISHLPIFFIFTVSNIGGCLTPLGDPPLFLGYLRGVPFTWTFGLVGPWAVTIALVLAIFYLIDVLQVRKESPAALALDASKINPLSLEGSHNFIFFAGVIGAVFLPFPWRSLAMVALAAGSFYMTSRHVRLANRFTFFPINEVAILFLGIFVTVVPALVLLQANGADLGLTKPSQFFWLTGILSAFLDNAPTYLTFSSLALAVHGLPGGVPDSLNQLVNHAEGVRLLEAISLGAVFMGAMTYIGNGPNFMVKAIVEERKMPMPSFFGFMGWSVAILVPVFLLITFLFLR